MEHLEHFGPLAARYDGFILDLWGVIHDGVTAFPHAVDCLRRLRAAGKRTLLLTNAPRPNAPLQAAMRAMGIADDLYTGVLTSGEAVRDALRDPPDRWWATLGARLFHLGPERDRGVFEGLAYTPVAAPAEADFVLNTGPDDLRDPTDPDAFEAELRDCLRYRLPMVCANPDLEVIRGGRLILCAGALALRYQALGGDMRMLGKPDPAIYDQVLQLLAVPAARVLAVGDALRTDIAGAAGVGIDACWVLDGIHANTLGDGVGGFDPARAEAAAAEAGLAPLATLPRFVW